MLSMQRYLIASLSGLMLSASLYLPQPVRAAPLPSTDYGGAKIPDFNRITLNDLTLGNGGSIKLPGTVRRWQSGSPLSQVLRLGDYGGRFSASLKTLGVRGEQSRLSQIAVLDRLTLAELLQAIPALDRYGVSQIKPLVDLLGSRQISVLPRTTLSQVLQQYPALGQLPLRSINLSRYRADSIPGVLDVPLERFPGWQDIPLTQTPLGRIPLTRLHQLLQRYTSAPGRAPSYGTEPDIDSPLISMVDIVYGPAEQEAYRTATGSDQAGFQAACYGQSCPHFEVAHCFAGNCIQLQDPRLEGGIEGRQFINGRYHRVRGGLGPLGVVCGYQEPTGRFSYEMLIGREFKVVLIDQDEALGTVQFGLYTQICDALLGCTGYCLGPIPLGPAGRYQEGEKFLM